MLAEPEVASPAGGPLADLVRLFTSPGALFANLPLVNRAGGALLVLLAAQLAAAAVIVATRVHDYEVSARAEQDSNRIAEQLKGDENSEELTKALEAREKQAVFDKMFGRVRLFVGDPLRLLLGIAVVASLCFLAVSLGGAAKADFRVLWGVVVFASCVELPRLLVRVVLVAGVHASRVETSLAAFLPGQRAGLAAFLLLRRLDPFELWYWALVGLGLWKTGQMSGRRALAVALTLAVLAALVQGCFDVGNLADYQATVTAGQ